jgi:hypothetical protein
VMFAIGSKSVIIALNRTLVTSIFV